MKIAQTEAQSLHMATCLQGRLSQVKGSSILGERVCPSLASEVIKWTMLFEREFHLIINMIDNV